MSDPQNTYSYFDKLEKRMKLSLAIIIFLLITGATFIAISIEGILYIVETISPEIIGMFVLLIVGLLILLIYLLGKVDWLGDLNMELDKYLLGYLRKSNDAILLSLLYALKPEERILISKLSVSKQNSMVQSVFSIMSNDERFFDILLETKIFSKWTWYWTTIYGLVVSTLLTLLSFIFTIVEIDVYTKTIFAICFLITLAELGVVNILGHKLVNYSKFIVDTLVESNKKQIAVILRENIFEEQEYI